MTALCPGPAAPPRSGGREGTAWFLNLVQPLSGHPCAMELGGLHRPGLWGASGSGPHAAEGPWRPPACGDLVLCLPQRGDCRNQRRGLYREVVRPAPLTQQAPLARAVSPVFSSVLRGTWKRKALSRKENPHNLKSREIKKSTHKIVCILTYTVVCFQIRC